MKAFIEHIIKHIVDNPDDIYISQITGEHTIVLELHAKISDMGKVIGRSGQMADALRTILAVASAKKDKRYMLEIIEAKNKQDFSENTSNKLEI